MSSSGPVERVPLKVVPMLINEPNLGASPSASVDPDPVHDPDPDPYPSRAPVGQPRPAPRWWIGALSVTLALAAALAQVLAIIGATAGDFEQGIVLAYLAAILAVIAMGVGFVAIVIRRGRGAGIAGLVLGIVANPLVLLAILRLVDGMQA